MNKGFQIGRVLELCKPSCANSAASKQRPSSSARLRNPLRRPDFRGHGRNRSTDHDSSSCASAMWRPSSEPEAEEVKWMEIALVPTWRLHDGVLTRSPRFSSHNRRIYLDLAGPTEGFERWTL